MFESIKKYIKRIDPILVFSIVAMIYVLFFWKSHEYVDVTVDQPQEPTIQYVYVYIIHKVEEEAIPEPVPEPKEKPAAKQTRSVVKKPPTNTKEFEITAYDNTVQSQGKWIDQTATGFNLKGHTLESAKCIAVDPNVIPLGSKVQLYFGEEYEHLNGVYIARDTGGAIKGNKIDLFMGDGPVRKEVMEFGRRKVQVKIIE